MGLNLQRRLLGDSRREGPPPFNMPTDNYATFNAYFFDMLLFFLDMLSKRFFHAASHSQLTVSFPSMVVKPRPHVMGVEPVDFELRVMFGFCHESLFEPASELL